MMMASTATQQATLKLSLLTPQGVVYEGDVTHISAMAVDGSLGIYPKHQPLITPLAIGLLKLSTIANVTETFVVMGGLLETDGNTITILSDVAESGRHINRVRAEQALRRAQDRLRNKQGINQIRAELALKRAMSRIEALRG